MDFDSGGGARFNDAGDMIVGEGKSFTKLNSEDIWFSDDCGESWLTGTEFLERRFE